MERRVKEKDVRGGVETQQEVGGQGGGKKREKM